MSAALVSKLRLIAEKMPREERDICTAAARTIEQDASLVAALARLIPVGDLLDATTNGLTMVNYFSAKLVEANAARAIIRELIEDAERLLQFYPHPNSVYADNMRHSIGKARAYLGEEN